MNVSSDRLAVPVLKSGANWKSASTALPTCAKYSGVPCGAGDVVLLTPGLPSISAGRRCPRNGVDSGVHTQVREVAGELTWLSGNPQATPEPPPDGNIS